MTNQEVRGAFSTVLKTFADANNISVAWENAKFETPSSDVLYLRATLLPANDLNMSLCYNTENKAGVFQIDIFSPVNIGTKTASDLAEQIKALYPQGSRVGVNGVRVTQPIGESKGETDKDRYILSLSIYYSLI